MQLKIYDLRVVLDSVYPWRDVLILRERGFQEVLCSFRQHLEIQLHQGRFGQVRTVLTSNKMLTFIQIQILALTYICTTV